MKKFYSIAVAAMCAVTATAGNFTELKEFNRNSNKELHLSTLELATAAPVAKAPKAKAETNAPASLVGKTYVSLFAEQDLKSNGMIEVEAAANDSIILGGFVGGYDVKAKYDAATGTITIPTGYVIATHSTYGDITMYALDAAAGKIYTSPITGTVDGDKITFDYGVYTSVTIDGTNYWWNWMQDLSAETANGSWSVTLGTSKFQVPLIVTKTTNSTISVVGLSNLLYGVYYEVPITFDSDASTVQISSTTPVDAQITSSKTNVFVIFTKTSTGLTESPTPYTVTENSTDITANTNMFLGYNTTGTSYSGYTFSAFNIHVDYNINTAKVDNGDTGEFNPTPTIGNVTYLLDKDTKTAKVTGCTAGIATIEIPNSVTMVGEDYKVVSVKDSAFMANTAIKTLSLPASITTVGQDAFRNTNQLRTLYIEDLAAWCGVKFANGNANPIYNVFPTSTSQWGKVYFNNTEFTGELTIPAGVKSIDRSFYGLKKLSKLNIPDGVETIGDQAFGNCTALTAVDIPGSVTSVGSAFFSCSALADVKLNEGLKVMGGNMFYSCKKITELTIPASVDSIAPTTFMMASNIVKLTSLATVPPATPERFGMTTFDDFASKCTLYVPAGTKAAYAEADGWKVFTNIEELPTSGVAEIVEDVDAPAVYFNLQGQKVNSENLTPGIYVVRKGNKASKVLVK